MAAPRDVLFLGGGGTTTLTPGTTVISGGTDTRVLFNDSGVVGEDAGFVYNKTTDIATLTGGLVIGSAGSLAFSTDLFLYRDAANTFAQRNSTTAQIARWYGSWTDASNGDWLEASKAAGGAAYIRTVKNGSGVASTLSFGVAGANYQTIDASGNFIFVNDNAQDIGASGATRPRNIYVAGTVTVGGNTIITGNDNAATFRSNNTGSRMTSAADGTWTFTNDATTGFGSLLLGPSGTTYNRLKHDATGVLAVKLADDSAYSTLRAAGLHSPSATAGVGYITGAGGSVAQATDRTTAVELNTVTGKVTTTNTSLAAITIVSFTVTNSTVAVTDNVILSKVSGDIDTSAWVSAVAAGSFNVSLRNNDAIAADTTAFVFNFAVIKGVIT